MNVLTQEINPMKKIIIYGLIFLVSRPVMSQTDSTLKEDELRVGIIFRPMLSEALKIPVNPNPELPETPKPVFRYALTDFQYSTTPTLYTIKPLSLGTALLPRLRNNYARLGFGNYASPWAELHFTSLRNRKWNNGVYLHHFSSNGDRDFNNFSQNQVILHSKLFINKNVLGAELDYKRNAAYLYGYFPDNLKPAEDSTRYIYNQMCFNMMYETTNTDSNDLLWKGALDYSYFSNNHDRAEHNFKLGGKFLKRYNGVPFELYTAFNSLRLLIKDSSYSRSFFDFNPRASLAEKDFYIKAGFNLVYTGDDKNSNFHFFPIAEGGYHILSKLTAYAGITGNLSRHTFAGIVNENLFIKVPVFENTLNKFEMYAGFKGHVAASTSYLLCGSIANVQHMQFFVQDSFSFAQIPVYDNGTLTLFSFTFDIQHQLGEKIRVGLVSKMYDYSMAKLQSPYSRPTLESKLNATYNIGDKFLLHADIFYVAERSGALYSKGTFYKMKLDPFADLNLGIDYRYNKTVSAFLNFNNIASVRYQRWYNYPVYGFNIMGGLTLTF